MMDAIRLALRYLYGYRRRFIFVVTVVALGFSFITVTTSLSDGMERSVTRAALRHYAGHVFVMGRSKGGASKIVMDDPDVVQAAVQRAGVPVERIIRRTHEHTGATLFFAGDTVLLKDVFGVDFRGEADLFQSMEYTSGRYEESWDAETIVLSEPTARQLRARVGDSVLMRAETRDGQVNTGTFTVGAISADDSIYGYARAYVARETLTRLLALDPAEYSVMGILLPDRSTAPHWARRIHRELAKEVPVSDPITSKEALTESIRQRWDGVRYFTIALPVYISEVTDLLVAMEIASYALLTMIILVILASVLVTYRLVLYERLRDVGTMRALGFSRGSLAVVLLVEAALVLAAAMLVGAAVAFVVTQALSLFSFEWIPGFDIFMEEGRLAARFTASSVGTNIAFIFAAVLPMVALMVFAIVRREIPRLIRGGIS
ncbi:MAG: FtsX-like permease family protein [Spirochaetota bacterium]